MLREEGTWDLRLPRALLHLFPERRGYWFKVNRDTAQFICWALSRAYRVSMPVVDDVTPKGANGWYHPRTHTISVHARAHVKTVFHEWYHHLDEVTGGRYDSSDWPDHRLSRRSERTTPVSLAWQYAERMFDLLREEFTPPKRAGFEAMMTEERRQAWEEAAARVMARQAEEEGWTRVTKTSGLEQVQKRNPEERTKMKTNTKQETTVKTNTKTVKTPKLAVAAKTIDTAPGFLGRALDAKAAKTAPEAPKGKAAPTLAVAKAKNTEAKVAVAQAQTKAQAPAAKAKKEPKAKGGAEDLRVMTVLVKEMPGREGTKAYLSRSLYKTGLTVAAWRDLCRTRGGDQGYVLNDVKRGYISLK